MEKFLSYNDSGILVNHIRDTHPAPENFFVHTHEIPELFVFISGKGVYHIEGTEYPLNSGDILLMRPMESHYIEISESEPYERLVINFRESLFDSIDPDRRLMRPYTARAAGRQNRYCNADFKNDNYKTFIDNMIIETEDRHLQVVSNLLPLLNEIGIVFDGRNDSQSHIEETPARRIIQYINANLTDDITLDTLCNKFYISKPQLCRVFKKATGTTVWEYISVKRLIFARQRIQSGGNPTRICNECGFNDYSVFYRAYIKKFGCSPKSDMAERKTTPTL